MKAHTHYITSVATVVWMRRGTTLAALLVLAAIGLAFALGRAGSPAHITASGAAARPAPALIARCRACADEALGAAPVAKDSWPAQPVSRSAARQRVVMPRVLQDEVLGADQANLAFLSTSAGRKFSQTAPAPVAPVARQRVVMPRVFRDEVLGADQANLAAATSPSGTLDQQDYQHRAGPR